MSTQTGTGIETGLSSGGGFVETEGGATRAQPETRRLTGQGEPHPFPRSP